MSLDPKNSADGSHPSTLFRPGDAVDIVGQRYLVDSVWRGLSNSPTGVRLRLDRPSPYGILVESVWAKAWEDDGLEFDEPDDGLDF